VKICSVFANELLLRLKITDRRREFGLGFLLDSFPSGASVCVINVVSMPGWVGSPAFSAFQVRVQLG